jgi:hypothetical protein
VVTTLHGLAGDDGQNVAELDCGRNAFLYQHTPAPRSAEWQSNGEQYWEANSTNLANPPPPPPKLAHSNEDSVAPSTRPDTPAPQRAAEAPTAAKGHNGSPVAAAVAIRRVDSIEALLEALTGDAASDGPSQPGPGNAGAGSEAERQSPEVDMSEFEWVEGVLERLEPTALCDGVLNSGEEEGKAKMDPHTSFMSFLKTT